MVVSLWAGRRGFIVNASPNAHILCVAQWPDKANAFKAGYYPFRLNAVSWMRKVRHNNAYTDRHEIERVPPAECSAHCAGMRTGV